MIHTHKKKKPVELAFGCDDKNDDMPVTIHLKNSFYVLFAQQLLIKILKSWYILDVGWELSILSLVLVNYPWGTSKNLFGGREIFF